MAYNNTNIVCGGDQTASGPNPLDASFPASAQALAGVQPFGLMDGSSDGQRWQELANWNAWKPSNIGTPTGGGLSLLAATASNPQAIQLSTGTASGAGTQTQASDGTTSTALGRYFSRAGNIIHYFSRFQLSNTGFAFLLGLCESNASVLTAGGSINSTDGIFLYKGTALADINLIIRRGGATTATVLAIAQANVDTAWHSVGFRLDAMWGELFIDGIRTPIDLSAGSLQPNAALTHSIAGTTGAAAARTITAQGLCAFQEAR